MWLTYRKNVILILYMLSSVTQSCLTLCDPMDCSMPDLPVHHRLPKSTQTHVHWVSDTIQLSHPLSSPAPPAFNLFNSRVFSNESVLRISTGVLANSIGVSASIWVLPLYTQDWFPLGWTGWISSQRDSQESSPTPQFKSINSLVLSLLYGPTLPFIHDYWRNHSLD